MTYKNMAFCPFYRECRLGESCERALTYMVDYKAYCKRRQVCEFLEKPRCFVEKKKDALPRREIESFQTNSTDSGTT